MAETTYVPGVAQFEQAPTGTGQVTYPSGMTTTFKTPTAKQQQAAGQSKLGDLIARMLQQIAQDKTGAYTAQQQQAAQGAFIQSGIETLSVTPKAAWDKIAHPGVSDYYWGEMKNMVGSGRTDPVQGTKSMLALQAEWSRRAEQSPYMTYPSGGVAAGKAHIPPYLEAGGLVSSWEYIRDNPDYARTLYERDPVYADAVLYGLYIPGVRSTYGGIDEGTRSGMKEAADIMWAEREKYAVKYPNFPYMAHLKGYERGQETYPWMQGQPTMATPPTPVGTLPPWAQPVGAGTTTPQW